MPNCDVCLVECRDGGVLACRHVVCRTCGMSQSNCLVCARIVGKVRRRLIKRPPSPPHSASPSASPSPTRTVAAVSAARDSKTRAPRAAGTMPLLRPRARAHSAAAASPRRRAATNGRSDEPTNVTANVFTNGDAHLPDRAHRTHPVLSIDPIDPAHCSDHLAASGQIPAQNRGDSQPPLPNQPYANTEGASNDEEAVPMDVVPKQDEQLYDPLAINQSPDDHIESGTAPEGPSSENGVDVQMAAVHGPSAFDEVRCELRAQGSTPKLDRSALRTTGKVSIAVLRKFLHARLNLSTTYGVALRCSGEDLIDAMTLGQLGTHVWPKSSGHIILEYSIIRCD